ncbi:MAG: hypothetical protein ABUK01_05665 [Leptospirales bacterium]
MYSLTSPLVHPFYIHFPIAISFILPFLIGFLFYYERTNERKGIDNPSSGLWSLIFICIFISTIFTILALASGSAAVDYFQSKLAEQSTEMKAIQAHEEIAELFGMVSYVLCGLSIFVFIYKGKRRKQLLYAIFGLALGQFAMALYAGKTGGAIIYTTGAAEYLMNAF